MRVKEVCIKPIVLKGATTVDNAATKLEGLLERVQKNMDEGCCRIELQQRDTVELKPPAAYDKEVTTNLDADTDNDVPQVVWDARSQDSTLPNKIILSPGMAQMLCNATPRDDECINIYLVKDRSMVGRFPPVGADQQDSRDLAAAAPVKTTRFGGADIKRQRLKPDGSGCETLQILKETENGPLEEIPADECQVNAVILGADRGLASFRTLKHEIGHMLGLRHPWEYTPEQWQEIKDSDQRPKGSVMYYRDDHLIYTRGECQLIMEHNCNGYLQCE